MSLKMALVQDISRLRLPTLSRRCVLGYAALILLLYLLWWRLTCTDGTCTVFQLVSNMLLADLPIVYHYKTKSYESFMRLQSGAGWKQYFQTGEFQGPKRHSDNKTELVVQNYMARNQTGSGVHDTSASRYASMLQRMRNTSLDERVPRYHPSRHCVLGYYGAGQLHCRRYFLTFMALVTSGQEKLLDDWISFHTALGVDHFAFLNVLNDSSVELALQKYVAHGIAELRGNRPTQDRLGTWKADWLAECAAGHCSFWVGYADLDEYLAPPRSVANLSSFLHPYTKRRNDTVFQKEPKQFQLMQKVFGSGRWYSDPPAGMPDIVAFTERGKELDWNGKSVALVDAVDLPQNKELVNFPHRFGLKAEVKQDRVGQLRRKYSKTMNKWNGPYRHLGFTCFGRSDPRKKG